MESETYQRMLEGTDLVSHLVTQYTVIDNLYAKIDSELSVELRTSLESFYVVILRHQMRAITYFDRNKKGLRALTGLNPISAEGIKKLTEDIEAHKKKLDSLILLIQSQVTKFGIDELLIGEDELLAGQKEQLAITRDGILALSVRTIRFFDPRSRHLSLLQSRFPTQNFRSNLWGYALLGALDYQPVAFVPCRHD